MQFNVKNLSLELSLPTQVFKRLQQVLGKRAVILLLILLSGLSIANFMYFYHNGFSLLYNDARSHLDIGRRVVDNLKPGFAQLGSVWLPLPHLLMTITIWNDFMWHSGLSGALESMISYVATGVIIYLFLKRLHISMLGRWIGVGIFALNTNIMYMQSTAMTELLLLGTMTIGVYELLLWHQTDKTMHLIKAAFWIMLATMNRYDGWFLLGFSAVLIAIHSIHKYGYKKTEGILVLFCTLAGFGIFLWILWNLAIFHDPLYFISGPYAAATQQEQLAKAGVLATKKNLGLSIETYIYAMFYNSTTFMVLLAALGAVFLWFDKRINRESRMATVALMAPFFFNILALYLGQSVIFVQGLSGNSWFNVRYGLMMVPSVAIFIAYLVDRFTNFRYALIGLLIFVSFFAIVNGDTVTLDDARYGASGKNVSEVSNWLHAHAENEKGYVLISVASHDAAIFSSGLDMKRFIHEGTGVYWDLATAHPQRYAHWVVMRTGDTSDLTYKILQYNPAFKSDYILVKHFPFADIYELKPAFVKDLQPLPVVANNT